MTLALIGYSGTFMRYALAVTPKNYLLFGCHIVNFSAQSTQAYRYLNYHYMGGRETALQAKAKEGLASVTGGSDFDKAAANVEGSVKEGVAVVEGAAKDVAAKAQAQVDRVTR